MGKKSKSRKRARKEESDSDTEEPHVPAPRKPKAERRKAGKKRAEAVVAAEAAAHAKAPAARKRTASTDSTARRESEELDRLLDDCEEAAGVGRTGGPETTAGAGRGEGKGRRTADGVVFELSSKRRITVRRWRKSVLVDVREFYEDKETGEAKPGRKGISLSLPQWEALKELAPDVDHAVGSMK